MPIPEPKHRNSAGRLLALLSAIQTDKVLLDTLPELFGYQTKTSQDRQQSALMGLMELHKLYLEFRQDMIDAEINDQQREVMLQGLSTLEQMIYPVQLNGLIRRISEAEIALLKVCATFIVEDELITKDDITAIRDSIQELRHQIEIGNISPTLRKALLEIIRLSEDAISRFNIHGARGLRRAFKAMLADAAELYGMTDLNADRELLIKSSAWATIIKHLKMFDAVASKLLKYKPLLEVIVSQFLISGPPSPK